MLNIDSIKMGHGAGHGRKKKKSILRNLAKSTMNVLVPNTYSRRMTRYSAYDADAVTVRVRSHIIDIFVFLLLAVFVKFNRIESAMCIPVLELQF